MASTKSVKNRIGSVSKIKKIANALEVVALTRLRRMESRAVDSRAYFEKIRAMLFDVSSSVNIPLHPFLRERNPGGPVGIICIFSDKGLCGNFNYNVFSRLSEFIQALDKRQARIVIIGKKGSRYAGKIKGRNIAGAHAASGLDAGSVIGPLAGDVLNGKLSELFLLYSRFRLHLLGEARALKLLPFVSEKEKEEQSPYQRDYMYEPGPYRVFENLVKEYIANQLQHGILESRCAEEMSRMLAMKSASENADEMIAKLRLLYNKTRQAQITKEIAEVVAASDV